MGVKDIAKPKDFLPNYPDWREPPLPSGNPTTPSGSRTIDASPSTRYRQIVGAGHRIPILYGRRTVLPDVIDFGVYMETPTFTCVVSEGPINSISVATTAGDYTTQNLGTMTGNTYPGLAWFYLRLGAGHVYGPACTAEGRLLYDPRLGAWGSGEYPDAAKTAYSANPALVMADILCFPQYGLGVSPAEVDWQSVEDAADWCDTVISGAKRYEVHLYLQRGDTADRWLETIGLHAGLSWRQSAGLWRLDYADGSLTPDVTITEDDLANGSSPSVRYGSGTGLSDLPNRFTAEYLYVNGYGVESIRTVTVQRPEVDSGEAPRDAATYRLHGFKTDVMAKRALQRIADEIYSEVEVDLPLVPAHAGLDVGALLTLQLPSLGLVDVDVKVVRLTYDAGIVRTIATLYAAETFTAPTSGQLEPGDPVGASDPPIGYLPSPPPPSAISASSPTPVLPSPSLGLVPVYRRVADTFSDGDSLVWDAADAVAEPGAPGGGGSPLTVKESDGAPSVADVTEIRVTGATVTSPGAGIVEIAVSAAPSSTVPDLQVDSFSATASQTAFVLSDAPLAGGILYVTRDGLVARSSDWSLAGSTVTFGTGLDAGVEVQIAFWRAVPDGTSPAFDSFTATAGQTDFPLAHPATLALVVARGGVVQSTTAWSITGGGTTLTFASGLEAVADVSIAYLY